MAIPLRDSINCIFQSNEILGADGGCGFGSDLCSVFRHFSLTSAGRSYLDSFLNLSRNSDIHTFRSIVHYDNIGASCDTTFTTLFRGSDSCIFSNGNLNRSGSAVGSCTSLDLDSLDVVAASNLTGDFNVSAHDNKFLADFGRSNDFKGILGGCKTGIVYIPLIEHNGRMLKITAYIYFFARSNPKPKLRRQMRISIINKVNNIIIGRINHSFEIQYYFFSCRQTVVTFCSGRNRLRYSTLFRIVSVTRDGTYRKSRHYQNILPVNDLLAAAFKFIQHDISTQDLEGELRICSARERNVKCHILSLSQCKVQGV